MYYSLDAFAYTFNRVPFLSYMPATLLSLAFFIHSWITARGHTDICERERDRERRVAKPGGDNALLHIQFITAHEYATDVDMTTDHREGPGLSSQLFNYVPTLHVHILPAKWAAAWQDRAERSNDCMRHAAQHLSEKLCTFYSLIRSLSLFFFRLEAFSIVIS